MNMPEDASVVTMTSLKQEQWLSVVQDCGALGRVPEAHRTPELCLAAVQKSGNALQFGKDKVKFTLTGSDYFVWLGEDTEHAGWKPGCCVLDCFYDGVHMEFEWIHSEPEADETFYYDKGWNKDTPVLYRTKSGSSLE